MKLCLLATASPPLCSPIPNRCGWQGPLCSIESQPHDILCHEHFPHNYCQDFQQWAKDPLLLTGNAVGAIVTIFRGDNVIL